MGNVSFHTRNFDIVVQGSEALFFRLEKRKGRMNRGIPLRIDNPLHLYASASSRIDAKTTHVLSFTKWKGVFIPNITREVHVLGYGEYHSHQVLMSSRKDGSGLITLLTPAIFSGLKVIQTRVGFFNADKFLDVAYTVLHPTKGMMTYILYFDSVSWRYHTRCVANSLRSANTRVADLKYAWTQLTPLVEQFVKTYKGGNPHAVLMFEAIAHLIAHLRRRGRKRAHSMILEPHLKGMFLNRRRYLKNSAEIQALVRSLLPMVTKHDGRLIKLFRDLTSFKNFHKKLALLLLKSLVSLSNKLTIDQVAALCYTFDKNPHHRRIKARGIILHIIRLTSMYSGKALYNKIYQLVRGKISHPPSAMELFGPLLRGVYKPELRDLHAADQAIGARNALLLWKKFGIVRFGRYHPSILKHLVTMARYPRYDRKKPLIIAAVARSDHSDMFYWGRHHAYDPRVRVVVVEVDNYKEFRQKMWAIRKEYGIPDALMLTSHGWNGGISYIHNRDAKKMKRDFKDFFGNKRGFVLLNSCYGGARGSFVLAQMIANAMNAEVRAARTEEGLLEVSVEIDKNGRARLYPIFFETRWPHFGFNYGGSIFYPRIDNKVPESVYNGAADTNVGWKIGGGVSVTGLDLSLDVFFGRTHAFFHRLRVRGDAVLRFSPLKRTFSASFDPELAVGITNQLLVFLGGRFGGTLVGMHRVKPLYQTNFGFKIVMPFLKGEFDIGAASRNGRTPTFYASFQGRF